MGISTYSKPAGDRSRFNLVEIQIDEALANASHPRIDRASRVHARRFRHDRRAR